MATYNEALKASITYFNGDELAATTFLGKYALKTPDTRDILEPTPDYMHHRLAKEFARIESKYPNPLSEEEIYSYLRNFSKIIPQGSPMAGIGNPFQVMSLSNCYVISSPLDSYSGIIYTDNQLANLMKRRSGVGIDLSNLRPLGMTVKNAAGTTTGIGTFMERFSNTTREVGQEGRRGALIETIDVRHPDIKTFINIKRDRTKVTGANISIRFTDEFMRAVTDNADFELKWPVDSNNPIVTKKIKARELWEDFIQASWDNAEPGALFWDTVSRMTPADIYSDFGFKTTSVNPCFSGDTLIAVADGRNAVSIKQLVEENKDVPVYSVNPKTGLISIKMARNPRITGYNKKLIRVKLDNGSYFDLTPDHKCMLRDGTPILVKDLKPGDSLSPFTKRPEVIKNNSKLYYRVYCNAVNTHKDKIFEHRLIAKFNFPKIWEQKYQAEKQNGWIKGGLVIHHCDYNSLNNSPDNLEIMTFKEHQQFHANNDNHGENNGNYSGISNEKLKEYALKLTKKIGKRFGYQEWINYAKKHNLPQNFSSWRKQTYNSVSSLSKLCAIELGYENINCDPRLTKTLISMIKQGYKAIIINNEVFVEKNCELCNKIFIVNHDKREIAYCSNKCSLQYINNDVTINNKRLFGITNYFQNYSNKNKEKQACIYSTLKYKLGRQPLLKEWEIACKNENISCRIGKTIKYGFKNWKEICEAGETYNHKVISISEIEGEHTVYNLTVEDNHTVAIVYPFTNKNGYNSFNGINVFQCGEICLSSGDSCRLLLLNPMGFISKPYTKDALFSWDEFRCAVQVAQRLMDDIVDLELECIDKIIDKVNSDPEPEDVKRIELSLWQEIKASCIKGRRTGLGLTAIGDMLASCGLRYGSMEAIEFIEEIYKNLALSSYRSSVNLAKERGVFPIFSRELEENHPYLQRLWNADPTLFEEYKKYGRRNICNLTTAPAGTVSLLAQLAPEYFQTTSGIEPAFSLSFIRRKKINPNDVEAKAKFIDPMGDKWQEYKVYHPGFSYWKHINNKTDEDIQQSPYWKSTAADINWEASVDLQAVAQKWIDHSISKTCNLPENVTPELVSKVFIKAWSSGCKGFTVYREGSRTGVLINEPQAKDPKKISFTINHAPRRPKELPCHIHNMTVIKEKWTFFVGIMEDKPYELIGGLSKYVSIPKRVKEGKILKYNGTENPVARYDLHYDYDKGPDEETIVRDITNAFENATHAAFTRTISLALRHGTPVQYIVEQLYKGSEKEDDLYSFSKAVERVLKNYVANGTKASGNKTCPNCNGSELYYQEGCISCFCGWTKCS